ncbi:hypothetical protein HHK36_026214 [Tetracentron sinense]|uniref:DUF547 domain-containing protein n=1 Tax=Tetracentron sinense TaxID=13715 RepID=A0A834YIB1_TETSI|nr:hypothetical protein HHK36_026214 [Tetracentron sinense]
MDQGISKERLGPFSARDAKKFLLEMEGYGSREEPLSSRTIPIESCEEEGRLELAARDSSIKDFLSLEDGRDFVTPFPGERRTRESGWCLNHCSKEAAEGSNCMQGFVSLLRADLWRHTLDSGTLIHDKKVFAKTCQHVAVGKLTKEMPLKGLWNYPNQLAEEMVRCMKNIFISLADSIISSKSSVLESHCSPLSPLGHLSNPSLWSLSEHTTISSWVQSPQVDSQYKSEVLVSENACDPYKVRGKLSWAEIGSYGFAADVSWMSVGKKQLEYAAGALRRFRTLVEQLAKVNPIHLSCNEKLAFWINLYNALIMHAYLAYGVPRSDLKLFSLMQKGLLRRDLRHIFLSDRPLNLNAAKKTTVRAWNSRSPVSVSDLDNGFLLFKFSSAMEVDKSDQSSTVVIQRPPSVDAGHFGIGASTYESADLDPSSRASS